MSYELREHVTSHMGPATHSLLLSQITLLGGTLSINPRTERPGWHFDLQLPGYHISGDVDDTENPWQLAFRCYFNYCELRLQLRDQREHERARQQVLQP